MKISKSALRAVVIILLLCVLAVLFFPLAFNSKVAYEIVIFTSIAVVVMLLLYLVKVQVFESGSHKHIAD